MGTSLTEEPAIVAMNARPRVPPSYPQPLCPALDWADSEAARRRFWVNAVRCQFDKP